MESELQINQESVKQKIGASTSHPTLVIFFIPTKDKDGKDIENADIWLKSGISVLSNQFGGATVMAPADGAWFNPETNEIISEKVHLVHSYGNPDENLSCFEEIANFLHNLGNETKQGEVGLVVDGVFHRITTFRKSRDD